MRRSHPFLRRTPTRRPGSSSPGAGAAGAGLGGDSCSDTGWWPAFSAITSTPGCLVREAKKKRLRREEWGSRNRAPKHRVTRPERKSRKRNFCGSRSPHGEAGTKPGTFLTSIAAWPAAGGCQLRRGSRESSESSRVGSESAAEGVPGQGCAPRGRRSGTRPKFREFGASPPARGRGRGRGGLGGARARGAAQLEPGPRARRALQPALRLVHRARALPRLPAPELSHAVCDALAGCAGAHEGPYPPVPEVSASGAVCNGSPRGCSASTAPRARARLVVTARGPAIRTRPQLCSAAHSCGTRGLQTLAQAEGCPRSACEACSWPRSAPGWEAVSAPKSVGSGAATREGAGLPLRSPVPGPAAPLAAQPPPPQLQTGRRRSGSHCDSAAAPPPAGHALRPRPHARPAPRLSARRGAAV